VRRREFIALVGGAAAWPLFVGAQQTSTAVIGFLCAGSEETYADRVVAFRQGLRETGHIEGQNVKIEYRWADGKNDRLPTLAVDLADLNVAVLVTVGATDAALAAKAATGTIPIVFALGSDPVKLGLVASLNRPGANITGVSFLSNMLVAKHFELMRELIPDAHVIGFLINAANTNAESDTKEAQSAASVLGLQLVIASATTESSIGLAVTTLARQGATAIVLAPDALFAIGRDEIVTLAARHSLPMIFSVRDFAVAGGLMTYGTSQKEAYRQVGISAGRILKGEKPADLPVQQSTKTELVINLRTAMALGLTVPPSLLARADEVIE
jgi:putative tryptophan/tyrosine transport system substrate-binding protein